MKVCWAKAAMSRPKWLLAEILSLSVSVNSVLCLQSQETGHSLPLISRLTSKPRRHW